MDVFICAFFAIVVFVIFVQCLRLIFADGDLTLLFAEKFGKPIESLAGKVIWITGASSGIGRALAVKLASVRCRLVISARRENELHKLKEECVANGLPEDDILVLPMDVTDATLHGSLLKKVLEHFQKLDILVNNAGRSQRAPFEKVDIQVDRDLFELNVFSQVALSTVVLHHFMERKQGHFAVTSSIAGKIGVPDSRSYTASKHAMHGYFESLRSEKGEYNIDVTMLCPGPVVSEILQHAFTDTAGKFYGQEHLATDKRMSSERCAHLCAVAIANKLDEAWIALKPVLLIYYASQYLPSITRRFMTRFGAKHAKKLRDGKAK